MVNLNNLLESVRKSDGINDTENTITNRTSVAVILLASHGQIRQVTPLIATEFTD